MSESIHLLSQLPRQLHEMLKDGDLRNPSRMECKEQQIPYYEARLLKLLFVVVVVVKWILKHGKFFSSEHIYQLSIWLIAVFRDIMVISRGSPNKSSFGG